MDGKEEGRILLQRPFSVSATTDTVDLTSRERERERERKKERKKERKRDRKKKKGHSPDRMLLLLYSGLSPAATKTPFFSFLNTHAAQKRRTVA